MQTLPVLAAGRQAVSSTGPDKQILGSDRAASLPKQPTFPTVAGFWLPCSAFDLATRGVVSRLWLVSTCGGRFARAGRPKLRRPLLHCSFPKLTYTPLPSVSLSPLTVSSAVQPRVGVG
jgi:hypothetical protein